MREDGSSVLGAVVYLNGTDFKSVTNENGFFEIRGVPPGKYVLVVNAFGRVLTQTIELELGRPVEIELFIIKLVEPRILTPLNNSVVCGEVPFTLSTNWA